MPVATLESSFFLLAQVQVTKALQTKLWGAPAEEMHPCWSKPTRSEYLAQV